MAEKHTERITQNYLIKLLNIREYNTTGNKQLFKKYIPDGWLQNDNNLLIIENKPNEKQLSEGVEQLIKYCKIVKQNKDNERYNVFCILSIGITEEEHKIYYFKYNEEKENLKKQKETQIKEIFANSTSSGLLQTVHNNIVNNFQTQDSKDLHDLLIIIIISILDKDFKKYYELKEDMIDAEFLDKLIELTEKKLNDSNNNYKRVEEYIKNSSFINSFKICKTIYNEYNKNPKFVNLLFQQFKKYNTYEGGNNEIWTPKDVARIMFKVAQKYIKKKDNITILDPCIGLNSLIYPFIDSYGGDNITVKGCDISDRLSLIGKLDLIIHGVSEKSHVYNEDFIKSERDLTADICVCNPPYTKNITNGYECLDFVIKSLEYSKYSVFIFPKNRLIKNKKLNEKLLNNCKIIEIIELGNDVFKGIGTGDIIICVFAKITNKNKDILTKYYNIKEFSKEYICIPHKLEKQLTNKGKQIINDYINENLTYEEYEPCVNNMFPPLQHNIIFENMKTNLNKQISTLYDTLDKIYCLSDTTKNILMTLITNDCENYETNIDSLFNYKHKYIIKVKFSDVFEKIKHKTTDKRKHNKGQYPYITRTMFNNGVDDYIDYYEFDTDENIYCIADLSGFVSYHTGKFSLGKDIMAIKFKEQYKHLDPITNTIILRNQLMNGLYSYTNACLWEKIKDSYINIYIGDKLFNDFDCKDKNKDDCKNNIKKVNIMQYFQIVKFKSVSINDTEEGEYPLYSSSMDEEATKHINKYNIDTKDENYIQINKQGSIGYCFLRNGKFSLTSSVLLVKPKDEYKDKINLYDNVKLLTVQLTNMGFNYNNSLNIEKLNNIELYLNINE